jgi:hypothetical protein
MDYRCEDCSFGLVEPALPSVEPEGPEPVLKRRWVSYSCEDGKSSSDEKIYLAQPSVDIPHAKRWDGEPEPTVEQADSWRALAKAGNFSEVKIPFRVLCWRRIQVPSERPRVL